MTRRVTGTLYTPAGLAVADATLRFVALATATAGVPQGVSTSTLTNEAGVYDVTMLPGYYAVHLQRGSASTLLGRAAVATGIAITLPGLLAAADVPEPTAVELTARVEALEQIPPGSGIASVVAGTGIDVDSSDPLNPVVSATGGGGGAVDSVNGQTGVVVLTAASVGADPAGSAATATSTAAAALAAHVGTGGTAHANAVAAGAAGFMTGADKTKLDGIATGATANAADSALRDRSTHTGTQAASTISDFAAAVAATAAVTANTAKVTNATHTGDVTGSGALTIANDVVTNAKLANVATATIKGRVTASSGDPEDLSVAQVKTLLNYTPADIGAAAASDLTAHTGATTGAHGLPDPATLVTSSTVDSIAVVTAYPDPEVAGVLYILVPA